MPPADVPAVVDPYLVPCETSESWAGLVWTLDNFLFDERSIDD